MHYLNNIIATEDPTVKITKCRNKVEIPQIKEEIGFEKLKLCLLKVFDKKCRFNERMEGCNSDWYKFKQRNINHEGGKDVIAIQITVNYQTKVIDKNICFVVNLRVSDRDSKAHCDEMIKYMNETSSLRTNETYGRKI